MEFNDNGTNWRPNADIDVLRARARLFAEIRAFFAERDVLEVDTPLLSTAGATDPQLQSLRVGESGYLVTSPEFAMKRLLATGSGAIYQLGHVFRGDESGRWHNPEFCMLEWYRPDWSMERLIDEASELLASLGAPAPTRAVYSDLFREAFDLDPHTAGVAALRKCAQALALAPDGAPGGDGEEDRGFWLDLLMGAYLGPRLGAGAPVAVTDYPACQAGLTRVLAGQPPIAERFELYWRGVELANGGVELTDADEFRRRAVADSEARARENSVAPPMDERLAAALDHGLPPCSGVAIGVDRLLALLLDFEGLAPALPFAYDRI